MHKKYKDNKFKIRFLNLMLEHLKIKFVQILYEVLLDVKFFFIPLIYKEKFLL